MVQFKNSFHAVVLKINYLLLGSLKGATLCKKYGALNVELFDATQHTSYLLHSGMLWEKAAI